MLSLPKLTSKTYPFPLRRHTFQRPPPHHSSEFPKSPTSLHIYRIAHRGRFHAGRKDLSVGGRSDMASSHWLWAAGEHLFLFLASSVRLFVLRLPSELDLFAPRSPFLPLFFLFSLCTFFLAHGDDTDIDSAVWPRFGSSVVWRISPWSPYVYPKQRRATWSWSWEIGVIYARARTRS